MASILEKIKAYKLDEIAARKKARPFADVKAAASSAKPPRDFGEALKKASRTGGYGLIAEIKKAPPSKGLIRENFQPVEIAKAYEAAGAACLSVLTDTPSFQGADEYLTQTRDATDLPALRKDFLYDTYQVYEARALGADCILIIMASVTDAEAVDLENAASDLGMDVLIEVHNREELDRSSCLRSPLLGINNRDLNTFETSLSTTEDLAAHVPEDKLLISESGLNTPADLARLARYGVRCFLIGESLMRQENVEAATRSLLASPWSPEAA